MASGERTPPSLLLLFGPPAVGKTTVGQELERLTGFRLFHLHQVVDLVTQYFPYSASPDSPYFRLFASYRRQFFEEAARSSLQVITTAGWWVYVPEAVESIRSYVEPFLASGGRVLFVELTASLEMRIARNRTENRRRWKRVDWSTEEYLRRDAELYQYHSGGTIPFDLPFLRIETDDLSAEETAERICAHFGLPRVNT
jgi:shikimate kinase